MKNITHIKSLKRVMGKMAALILSTVMLLGLAVPAYAADNDAAVKPSTWTAVDGLGRTVNSYDDVGDTRENKYVGIFYWTWHYDFARSTPARNVTEIINAHPEARNDYNHSAWGANSGMQYFFWDKPVFDYYVNTDEYVIRKHAELLADAGVDVIFFDCTNGTFLWEPAYETVFKVFEEAREEGVNTPQIAFLMNFAGGNETCVQIEYVYNSIYSPGRYEDLWFKWEGKPLVMASEGSVANAGNMAAELRNFFTFRSCNPSYYASTTSYSQSQWGWCSVYPQTKYGKKSDGSFEQLTVSVAQNASDNGNAAPVAMNDYRGGVYGRGYAKGDYSYTYTYQGKEITIDKNTKDAYLYGLNFQQQWDYAMLVDPDFVFVTGWNEWVAIRQPSWQGTPNAFADQYNAEFSRDIEPSDGILKDYFYYQLVSNIRRFKGVEAPEISDAESGVYKTIDINAGADQWADVHTVYNHYINNTRDRDSAGWVGLNFKHSTMRNDFVSFKAAYDDDTVYFLAETKDDITDPSGASWMHLYIDTDPTGISPNWEGFEYIVNRVSPNGNECTVEISNGGWNFTEAGKGQLSVQGNILQISIPRSVLGLESDNGKEIPSFNFKWTDNTVAPGASEDSGDILDFYKYGDAAPGGRFMFAFNADIENDDPGVTPGPGTDNPPADGGNGGDNGGQNNPNTGDSMIIAAAVVFAALAVSVLVLRRRYES